MNDLSLHILDVAENSINAGATLIRITVVEDIFRDLLQIEIEDNGKGMTGEVAARVTDPFYTTRTTRKVGLGLSLLEQAAQDAGGGLTVGSRENEGTTVSATFRHSHIDRKPLGNLADTMTVLIVGKPDIDFVFTYRKNDRSYALDTRTVRRELEGIPLNTPSVAAAIKGELEAAMEELRDA